MTERRLEYVPLDELLPAEINPKAHDDAGISASIQRFGTIEIITLDERTGRIVSGHGRRESYLAQRDEGIDPPDGVQVDDEGRWLVPVVRGWASADDAEARAAIIAVNRLVERGGWDRDELVGTLESLRDDDRFDLALGFSNDDLDLMIAEMESRGGGKQPAPEPEPKPDREIEQRVSAGDVWQLGRHRLICGSCRDPETVARLLDGAAINVAVTSPPYADRRKYDETTEFEPIRPDEYVGWFEPVAAIVAEHLADDGSWFVNIKPGAEELDRELYVYDLAIAHVREWGWHLIDEFCWERLGVPGRVALRFKNQWESVFHFARTRPKMRPDQVRHYSRAAIIPAGLIEGDAANWQGSGAPSGEPETRRAVRPGGTSANMQGLGTKGGIIHESQHPQSGNRKSGFGEHQGEIGVDAFDGLRDAGLAYPGNRLPTFAGSHEATGHAAAYPVGLPEFFIKAYTDKGDVVFDPFLGSGSTILAAERSDRVGFGVELSPAYCDIVLDRWERHGGEPPTRLDAAT